MNTDRRWTKKYDEGKTCFHKNLLFYLRELRAQQLFPESARRSVLGGWLLIHRAPIQNSKESPAKCLTAVQAATLTLKTGEKKSSDSFLRSEDSPLRR